VTRSPDRARGSILNRLSLRLALALGLGAGAVLLVAGSLNIDKQRESLLELTQSQAESMAHMVRRSTREAMLANKPEDVQGILESLGGQHGIQRIRIFDQEGRIRSSSRRSEIGGMIEQAPACVACHEGLAPAEHRPERDCLDALGDERNGQLMGVLQPIPNEPACSTADCHAHPPTSTFLGVLDIQLDLGVVDDHIASSTRQLGLGLIATILLVLLLSGVLAWYLVLRPVAVFTEATRRLRRGDLTTRVPIDSTYEIGSMGRSWNSMVDEIVRAKGKLEDWSHTLEDRVKEKTAQLESAHEQMLVVEKMASLGKLAAVVAHEINNPLAGIGTYAKLLQRRIQKSGGVKPEEAAHALEALELMETEAVRCGRIVQNLLLFSRTPGARHAETDLAALIERCVMLVQHRADLQDVSIHRQVMQNAPLVECDASQIQQVLLALCMNALDAMEDGGSLRITFDTEGESIVLTVGDTGHGIDPADLPHIFEPFYSTKAEGAGVGLGLAVVYGVVRRHNGVAGVTSKVGEGTTFTITLPRRQPAEKEPDAGIEPVGVAAGGTP